MKSNTDWQKLAETADAMPVPLLGVDEFGSIRLANQATCLLLASTPAQLVGKPFATIFRDPNQAEEFRSATAAGSTEPCRARLQRGDGSRLRAELTPGALAGLHGIHRGWIVMLRDAEADARKERDISRSIETVAHDMKTPLASLLGFANLLRREFGGQLDSVGRGYLDSLSANIGTVQDQLERLIELGRVPERELERSRLLANSVFSEIAEELSSDLAERSIDLQLPADPQMVYANRHRFHQVVLNLVVNAIRHMGCVDKPEIGIELKPVEGGHVLVVSDNGEGLPPERHLRIFDLFRSASFGEDARESGLGLSIVKRIMASHGGWIELDSQPCEGARFRAFFPGPPQS